MVIEVFIAFSGMPSNSARMSPMWEIATPTLPTSPRANRMVAVVAGLGRQVEGDRQAGLALGEIGAIETVRTRARSNGRRKCERSTACRARPSFRAPLPPSSRLVPFPIAYCALHNRRNSGLGLLRLWDETGAAAGGNPPAPQSGRRAAAAGTAHSVERTRKRRSRPLSSENMPPRPGDDVDDEVGVLPRLVLRGRRYRTARRRSRRA